MHKIPILLTSHYQLKYEVHFFSSGERHFLKGKDRYITHISGGLEWLCPNLGWCRGAFSHPRASHTWMFLPRKCLDTVAVDRLLSWQ